MKWFPCVTKACTRSCARTEQVASIPAMAAYHPQKYRRIRLEALSKEKRLAFHLPGSYDDMFMTVVARNVRDRNPAGDFLIIGCTVLV